MIGHSHKTERYFEDVAREGEVDKSGEEPFSVFLARLHQLLGLILEVVDIIVAQTRHIDGEFSSGLLR